LDKPYPIQYLTWLKGAALLDFGKSVNEQIPATTVVRRKILPTLQLAMGAYAFAIAVGVPLGILSATKRGTKLDLVARSFALVGQASPGF
jgi:peptide/nickel transport system permease protein